jgi:N utilization substance protein A
MVVSELRGEKIDIIPWNPEPARFVAKALSPARVREVLVDDESKEATVVVPDDQLSLAIGKEGLNARLAARLTGWKVDITSETDFARAESEAAFGGDDEAEFSGRCAAVLANGKRCPNTSLPGSKYCGIPAHRELAAQEEQGGAPAPVEAPAAEEPAEEPVAEAPAPGPPAEEPTAEEPVAETPAPEEQLAEAPAPEAPAEEPAADESAEEPAGEQPAEEPVAEEPVAQEPAEEAPATSGEDR